MRFSTNEQHAALQSPETSKLGKLHWYLLKSSNLMDSLSWEAVEKQSGSVIVFKSPRTTPFGKEVGRDEIDWWINRKEDDLDRFS